MRIEWPVVKSDAYRGQAVCNPLSDVFQNVKRRAGASGSYPPEFLAAVFETAGLREGKRERGGRRRYRFLDSRADRRNLLFGSFT